MFKERIDVKPVITAGVDKPFIFVTTEAIQKMHYYCKHCGDEIGWLGTVQRYEGNKFLIKDTVLFKQEVHSATCELSKEDMADFITELVTTNPEEGMEIANTLKLWGHSHVNMGVSPSGQDDKQIEEFKDGNEYFIRVICNKCGEMEFTLFDFIKDIKYYNVPWKIYLPEPVDLEEQIKSEIQEKVTKMKNTVHVLNGNNNYVVNNTTNTATESKFAWDKNLKMTIRNIDGELNMKWIKEKISDKDKEKVRNSKDYIEQMDIIDSLFWEQNLTIDEVAEIIDMCA